MSSIADALSKRESELVAFMVEVLPSDEATSAEEQLQFIGGYVKIMIAAAGGDEGPRNDYLETVVPGIKDAGVPLSVLMTGMVQVAGAVSAVMGKEHSRWLIDFNGRYATRLMEIWAS